jgi:polyhydroxybutyrate depolymerase
MSGARQAGRRGIGWAACLLCLALCAFRAASADSGYRPEGPGGRLQHITVDGVQRTFIVHVPPTYRPQTPMPLVIMLHGGGGTAVAARWETGWAAKAEREGFLVAFPNAMARDPARPASFAGNPQLWNDGSDRFYPGQVGVDDVAFVAAMLGELARQFNLDERRVFVTGFSNGASMSFRVGAELSDRIAAIAPVAGALWLERPALRHPVSMLYLTGTDDPLNLIDGGVPRLATGASDPVRAKPKPPVRQSVARWAEALGCAGIPPVVSDDRGVRTESLAPCRNYTAVVYIAVEGLGHTWAGGKSLLPERLVGKTSDRLDATDVIWRFFDRHPRARRHGGAKGQRDDEPAR